MLSAFGPKKNWALPLCQRHYYETIVNTPDILEKKFEKE
jgi:hypothetical protein